MMPDQQGEESNPLRKRTSEGQRPGDEGDQQEQPKSPRTKEGSRPLPQRLSLVPPPALFDRQGSGLRLVPQGTLAVSGLEEQPVIREQKVPLQAVVGTGSLQLQGTSGSKTVPRLTLNPKEEEPARATCTPAYWPTLMVLCHKRMINWKE